MPRHFTDKYGQRFEDRGMGYVPVPSAPLGAVNFLRAAPNPATALITNPDQCLIAGGDNQVRSRTLQDGRVCEWLECHVPLDPWDPANNNAEERIVTYSTEQCYYPGMGMGQSAGAIAAAAAAASRGMSQCPTNINALAQQFDSWAAVGASAKAAFDTWFADGIRRIGVMRARAAATDPTSTDLAAFEQLARNFKAQVDSSYAAAQQTQQQFRAQLVGLNNVCCGCTSSSNPPLREQQEVPIPRQGQGRPSTPQTAYVPPPYVPAIP